MTEQYGFDTRKVWITFWIMLFLWLIVVWLVIGYMNTPTKLTIRFEMDNNTLEAIKSMNNTNIVMNNNNTYEYTDYFQTVLNETKVGIQIY